jgi:hypothetical protein
MIDLNIVICMIVVVVVVVEIEDDETKGSRHVATRFEKIFPPAASSSSLTDQVSTKTGKPRPHCTGPSPIYHPSITHHNPLSTLV